MNDPERHDDSLGVLLLSGAGLPDWIWDDVRAAVEVPTLVARYASDRREMRLADYARVAVEQVAAARLERVLVVGHSIGGVVGMQAVDLLGERAVGFLGVAAAIPAPGASFLSSLPLPQRFILPLAIRIAGTRPPDKSIRSGFCNGLEPRVADRIVAGFTPESVALYRDRLVDVALPDVRGYVTTTRDKEFPIAQQSLYARRLDGKLDMTIDSGHLPMISAPEQTADAIRGCVEALAR